jgi:HD-GYP domain-containing protein (c-di-GMP phosphodiesterase class II)
MMSNLGELVSLLSTGISHGAVYHGDHPRVRAVAEDFVHLLAESLEEAHEDGLFLGLVDGRLVHDGRPLVGPTLIAKRLIDAGTRLHSGGFLFRKSVSADELTRFFALCVLRVRGPVSLEESRQLFVTQGIRDIAPSPLYGEPGWLGDHWDRPVGGRATLQVHDAPPPAADAGPAMGLSGASGTHHGAITNYQRMFEMVEDVNAAGHDDRDVDAGSCRGVAESLFGSLSERPADLMHLSRYPDYDSYTVGHSVRVAILAVLVAQQLRYPSEMLVEIGTAALLHDAGKGKIPHEILYKRGSLDLEERRVMSTHSVLGAEILIRSRDTGPLSIAAAFGHHIRHDRRGYPAVGKWARTSKVTGLIQVCDMFEALTAVRPYKPCLTPQRAYEIMLEDPGAFDPAAFSALIRTLGLYPPGSRVLLDSGEEAFVLRPGPDPTRPLVQLTHDAHRKALSGSDRRLLDLAHEPASAARITQLLIDDVREVVADPHEYSERSLTVVTQPADAHGHGNGHSNPATDACAH